MIVHLTYDYELFFGKETGTAQHCIIEPTNRLRDIAQKTGAKMTFFIDVGYIKQLKAFQKFPEIKSDLSAITSQIRDLVNEGHDCQLHIHPHWEDSYFDGERWVMNVDRYKLADFDEKDIMNIVSEYQSILADITHRSVTIFRAGGWCLQPFSKVKSAFEQTGIKIDSTVFFGGINETSPYYYNFTNCPQRDHWQFTDDLCVENQNGIFTEFPISSYKYSSIFFWKLFLLGRLLPKRHKPIGDGYPVPTVGMRKEMLTKGKLLSASCDGYFVKKLNKIIKSNQKKGFNHTVIIGHPKALTEYSIERLEQLIIQEQTTGNTFELFET